MVHEYQQFVSDLIFVYGPLVTLICSNFSFRSVRNFVIDLRRCVQKRMVSFDNNLRNKMSESLQQDHKGLEFIGKWRRLLL